VLRKRKPSESNLVFNPDQSVITDHVQGEKSTYKATTGTMPVWDEDGKIAGRFVLHLL
jgi:carboxypeptidase C (cathepsin A)